MSKYSEAEIAARDAVIQALYDNVDQNTLGDLWRHYLGLRSIAETKPKATEKIFLTENEVDGKIDNVTFPVPGGAGDDNFRVDDNGFIAGDAVNTVNYSAGGDVTFVPDGSLEDVITFNTDVDMTSPFTYGFDSSDTIVFGGDTEKKEDEETT
tara:strand:- start:64 stop:522 length:459 start_codon:yes stop_codon:yes gene_type:complete